MTSPPERPDVIWIPNPEGGSIRSILAFRDKLFAGCVYPRYQEHTDASCILSSSLNAIEFTGVYAEKPVNPGRTSNFRRSGYQACPYSAGDGYHVDFQQRGCSGLTVFKSRSTNTAALYASVCSDAGNRLLVSGDGTVFETIPAPAGGAMVCSMAAFHERLFCAAVDEQLGSILLVADDPVGGGWKQVTEPGFGDAENIAITTLAEFNGRLYAGTLNPYSGFQVWCTDANGNAPFRWQPVIKGGALRYTANMAAVSIAEFQGSLYVGTGSPPGYDAVVGTEPEAAELIRIYPDNRWDIVVGGLRFSPDGLKVPMAAMGPGFDDASNITIGSMVAHSGRLYAGTYSSRVLTVKTGQRLYDLWYTEDGDDWSALSVAVPESARAPGFVSMASINSGLLLAMSDHPWCCELTPPRSRQTAAAQPAKATVRGRIARLFGR